MAHDCRNCYKCGKPGHLTKDCLNYYSCERPGHFGHDCSDQDKSTPKQGNAGDCALAQGEAESGTSLVVAGSKWPVVSVLKASRMLFKRCGRYLASIVDTTRKVVTELLDVQ